MTTGAITIEPTKNGAASIEPRDRIVSTASPCPAGIRYGCRVRSGAERDSEQHVSLATLAHAHDQRMVAVRHDPSRPAARFAKPHTVLEMGAAKAGSARGWRVMTPIAASSSTTSPAPRPDAHRRRRLGHDHVESATSPTRVRHRVARSRSSSTSRTTRSALNSARVSAAFGWLLLSVPAHPGSLRLRPTSSSNTTGATKRATFQNLLRDTGFESCTSAATAPASVTCSSGTQHPRRRA